MWPLLLPANMLPNGSTPHEVYNKISITTKLHICHLNSPLVIEKLNLMLIFQRCYCKDISPRGHRPSCFHVLLQKYMALKLIMPPLQTLSSEWWSGWFPTAQVCLLTFPHTNMPFPHCIHNRTDYAKLLLDLGAIYFPWPHIEEAIQFSSSANAAHMLPFCGRKIQRSLHWFLYKMKWQWNLI